MTDVHQPEVETKRPPVTDWATDFDHTHPDYAAKATEIWDDLRETCPVAHSERFGGTWLPTKAEHVRAIAEDTEHFTSRAILVNEFRPPVESAPVGYAPPISSDPPFHQGARRLLQPPFAPKAIQAWEPMARQCCQDLLDEIEAGIADGTTDIADAAIDYAQDIPVRVIAAMLGLPEEDGDKFRLFIHRILETPGQHEDIAPEDTLVSYLSDQMRRRRESGNEGDDLISYLLDVEDDNGNKLTDEHVFGSIALLLIAGIDTTWSAIGASLWHLAQHPEDRQRWIDDEAVRPFAIEEFLRFYAPVTMARIVAEDVEIGGCPMKKEDWVLLSFPSYNRDPEMFEQADEFVIDRAKNRHSAFGLGIHRCLGSNLARLELTVAIEEWMARFPHFELADPAAVRWSTGQVRGPRTLPVRILTDQGASS